MDVDVATKLGSEIEILTRLFSKFSCGPIPQCPTRVDENINVLMTVVGGRVVYEKQEGRKNGSYEDVL